MTVTSPLPISSRWVMTHTCVDPTWNYVLELLLIHSTWTIHILDISCHCNMQTTSENIPRNSQECNVYEIPSEAQFHVCTCKLFDNVWRSWWRFSLLFVHNKDMLRYISLQNYNSFPINCVISIGKFLLPTEKVPIPDLSTTPPAVVLPTHFGVAPKNWGALHVEITQRGIF